MDCAFVLRYIDKGQYLKHRAFFKNIEKKHIVIWRHCYQLCTKEMKKLIKVKEDRITTIILEAELMMYGYLAVRISQENDKIIVSWFGMADGGQIVEDKQKEYKNLSWAAFIDSICALDFPQEEDYTLSVVWGLQLGDENDELVYELERGLWDIELLDKIVDTLEHLLKDEEPLSMFRNIFELEG